VVRQARRRLTTEVADRWSACIVTGPGGSATRLNGYSIVQAEDVNDLLSLVKDHPYQALGGEYSIEAYSLD
jgi:hypothetical protein